MSIAITRAAPASTAHCTAHRPDGTEAQDGDHVTRGDAAVDDRVVAGAHDVAGEQRDVVGEALRDAPQREVRERDERQLGLRALQVAEAAAVAERARVLALVEQRAPAEPARAARDLEAAEDAVADRDARDRVAGGDDLADELVADREALLDPHAPVVDVQVGPADPAGEDADDRVVRRDQLGIGLLDQLDVLGTLEGDGLHAAGRYRPFFASACFFGTRRLVRPARARRSASFRYSASEPVNPSARTSMSSSAS